MMKFLIIIHMRHFLKLITLSAVCCMSFNSCGNRELRKQMSSFMAREIVLPAEMTRIQDGKMKPVYNMALDKPTLILFYGKDECSSCAIHHLSDDLSSFKRLEEEKDCRVMILFSISQDQFLDVPDEICELEFPFPVYVDIYGDFYRENEDFPSDRRFHSFLVGVDGHPVFVGSPFDSDNLRRLFERALMRTEKRK